MQIAIVQQWLLWKNHSVSTQMQPGNHSLKRNRTPLEIDNEDKIIGWYFETGEVMAVEKLLEDFIDAWEVAWSIVVFWGKRY